MSGSYKTIEKLLSKKTWCEENEAPCLHAGCLLLNYYRCSRYLTVILMLYYSENKEKI